MFKQLIFLLAIIALAQAKSMKIITKKAEQNLADVLVRSSSSIEKSPGDSMACFQMYTPILNQLTNEFERNYTQCVHRAERAQYLLETEMGNSRHKLLTEGEYVCEQYAICQRFSYSVDFFECYSKAASEASRVSYAIEKDAKERKQYTKFQADAIVYEDNRCRDEATKSYEMRSGEIYEELNACLGRI